MQVFFSKNVTLFTGFGVSQGLGISISQISCLLGSKGLDFIERCLKSGDCGGVGFRGFGIREVQGHFMLRHTWRIMGLRK